MIAPLSKIKTVLILVDWNGIEKAETVKLAREFFDRKGVALFIINPRPKDFNILGHIRKRSYQPGGRRLLRHEDLLISLATGSTRAEKYELRNTTAFFKIGRSTFRKQPYDILITDGKDRVESQKDVLATILNHLTKIV